MKLEQQVTSLEISKRLKELGVKQDGYFFHASYEYGKYFYIADDEREFVNGCEKIVSAFTVAELGEMLPENYMVVKNDGLFEMWKFDRKNYELETTYPVSIKENTEADARGKMLIYLLENKLIIL